MKEKIIKILKSHSYHHTEGVGVKSQFKYLAEIAFECCADEIMLALDQSQFTADEAEDHINQEVERRIAERMPSEEERHIAASEYEHKESMGYSEMDKLTGLYRNIDFEAGADWACSRLTNDSQKTEGGGE